MRLGILMALAALLLTVACGLGGETSTPGETREMNAEIERVETSLASVASVVGEITSEDLSLAWSDLEADMSSVIDDLEREPLRQYLAGMQERLTGFRERFDAELSPVGIAERWDRLVVAVVDLESTLSSRQTEVVARSGA